MRTIPRRVYLAELERWRENLIDLDLTVDLARNDLDRAVQALRDAVRERNGAANHLRNLIDLAA